MPWITVHGKRVLVGEDRHNPHEFTPSHLFSKPRSGTSPTQKGIHDRGSTKAASEDDWVGGLSAKERAVLEDWTANGHKNMRLVDRGLLKDSVQSEKLEILRGALSRAPLVSGTFHRGVSYLDSDSARELLQQGNVLRLEAISSFSERQQTARGFLRGKTTALLHFETDRAVPLGPVAHPGVAYEGEHVLERGSRFLVNRVETDTDGDYVTYHVHAKEVL